ncbi:MULTISPECIES: mechanosensitive ion channel family protein [unclassified Nodularia (in: cyanobacteria)]|uniref:mechanosensitive ion channel family protein n=1 Tax=unclassified Nodularia (in: cyanobacteria) TaxID=2656917 RepID=UPI00188019BB|nr:MULTISPECIES: mechanosensitive ion channel family protein [unclassified Nodularia (in: cyanobacteria)]MBE9201632.1 mechanosensitive ion channel [Nodularia sp. LEGE 06071]MCC2691900.1 mechanosensitive ion channel [Nodularia sp. LEGE 04288]
MHYRIRTIVAGVVCVFALWSTPGRTEEQPTEEPTAEQVQPAVNGDPRFAITTQDPTVPTDELQLLVKPLTLEELQNESAAWLILLKDKVQRISNAEIAIKRENRIINQEKEASAFLLKSVEELKAAEAQFKTATPGSPEYGEAVKELEAAKKDMKKGQEFIQKAQKAKQDIQQDDALKNALENAQKTAELDQAKAVLDATKKQREQFIAGSFDYNDATNKIYKLDAAITAFEEAQTKKKESVRDSLQFKKANEQLDAAQKSLKQVIEEIEGFRTPDTTKKSSRDLNQAASLLENTKIEGDGSTKVAGSIDTVNNQESFKSQEDKLEQAGEQLDENANAEAKFKNEMVVYVTELQSDRTAIVDRFKVVLAELERKGGEPEAYHKYITAISMVAVDLQDTEGLLVRLISWVQSGEGGLRWADHIGKFVGIVILSIIVSQILGMILNRSLKQIGGASELLREFIVMLIKRGGVVVGVMLALTALEVSLGPILALVGGASFVLAFALQNNLGNFASGLMIMINKPFDIGDEIKVGGIWGYVDSISLASTKIEGFQGQIYVLPNNSVWEGMIENLTHREIRKVSIWLRVGLNEDLERIQNLLLEIMKSHPKVLEDPKPGKVLWSLEEYYFSIGISGWTKTVDFWGVHADVIQMIQERFKAENIQMSATPESNLNLLQNTTQIPEFVAEQIIQSLP